eukprot:TRINITY_DN19633_c0_g1_i1.p1 TRINITY_DN19633_c0_g1~~TRINITY_DN19633_c0_g1_i1.p1  ORF type:complete len:1322 (+),score=452.04 TRINITY_DN19633_c0_g1_i1:70-3966(+)
MPVPPAEGAEVDAGDGVVDYAASYRRSCEQQGCRINSAVAARLEAASFRPLTLLDLAANYVGPRGVLPILDLLARNQTVETLDLSRNGLDNTAVSALVAVARSHLGLTELNLSHNAITQVAGKELFALVEENDRIVDLGLEGTQVYDSLLRRIDLSVTRNRELHQVHPVLRSSNPRPPEPRGLASSQGTRVRTPAAQQKPQQQAEGAEGTAAADAGEGVPGTAPREPRAPPPRNQKKPRPPPPMMASSGFRRMTPAEREAARADYQRRAANQTRELDAHLRSSVERAERIGVASAEARRKLEALEREQRDAQAEGSSKNQGAALAAHRSARTGEATRKLEERYGNRADGADQGADGDELGFLSQEARDLIAAQEEKIMQAESEVQRAQGVRERIAAEQGERERLAAMQHAGDFSSAASPSRQDTPGPAAAEGTDAAALALHGAVAALALVAAATAAARDPPEAAVSQANRLAQLLADDDAADHQRAGKADAAPPSATTLQMPEGLDATGRRFFELFNAGGAAYNSGEMEGAYEAWNEALEVATKARNREWQSIINGNIQALSYQLLALQGDEHLEQGRLDEALHCLALARDVATKARNAQWERAAGATMNSVRRAQFKDKYSAGARAFEPLIAEMERGGTAQPPTVEEGATAAFSREWPRLRRIKEALECWAAAAAVAASVTGKGRGDLTEMVRLAVASAFNYEQAVSLAPQEDLRPAHAAQGTGAFSSKERAQLLDLWGLLRETAAQLGSPHWEALALSKCGNLHHSLYQNSHAVRCLSASLQLAHQAGHGALEASARTHLGRVHAGLARYSEAERELWTGEAMWQQLLGEDRLHPAKEDSAPRVPRAYIVEQLVTTYETLQQVFIGQHRYQDALEMAERARAHLHDDQMREKMRVNFDTRCTVDHMYSIARGCQTVLVVYSMQCRFDWDVDAGRAEPQEQLCMWAIPPEGELKFVLVEVTKDHHRPSIEPLIDQARAALGVETDEQRRRSGRPLTSGVITDAPSYAWRSPLQQLYDFLIYPIADFLSVTAGVQYVPTRKVTFVPHGVLHLVPWPALMDGEGRYIVEDFNIQLAPTVQGLALARLNAAKLREQGLTHQQLAVIAMREDDPDPHLRPFDDVLTDDSQGIAAALGGATVLSGESARKEAVLGLLPGCRLLHVCAEVYAEARVGGGWGAVGVSDGLLSSTDIERLELQCELAVLHCCNHSKDALLRGGDGALGMQRALMCAGVPTVVGALWTTPNQSSVDLLSDFYQLLRDDERADKAVALSVAQRRRIKEDPYNPAQWAGFYSGGVATL